MKECRKFSVKFNMTKNTAALQLGATGQWPVWPVVKTALCTVARQRRQSGLKSGGRGFG